MKLDEARKVADAVLYEGYLLYPYRPSSTKNRFRWQFGVVAPRSYSEDGGGEPWAMQTECLIEPRGAPAVDIYVRFLQIQVAQREQGGPSEEGVEREVAFPAVVLAELGEDGLAAPFTVPGGREVDGETVRRRLPIEGIVRIAAEPAGEFLRLRVRIENLTPANGRVPEADAGRSAALHRSLVSAHTLMEVRGGWFLSLTDPPPAARRAADTCSNLHTWPVLVGRKGERSLLLSSPIILYDYPVIAPESAGDLFDSTEIDELLTLRIMTLTDEEKREACAADGRARALIERSDSIPPQVFERMHGAVRSMGPAAAEAFFNPPDQTPFGAAAVAIGGQRVSKGSRVRLHPRKGADSMDMFLDGRAARVEGVYRDVEDQTHVAVIVEDDPAAELNRLTGRFLYFRPDELEPIH